MAQRNSSGVDTQTRSDIGAYLSRFCDELSDARLGEFLGLSVGRILLRRVRLGSDWRSVATDEQLQHIADWLKSSLINDASWLSNVDAHGRPKKLMKFASIDQITREANKAMLKASQRLSGVKLVEGDEELFAKLEDGNYVVRLLTPTALDRESSQMQHCIGHGAYDTKLLDERCLYLSLRDASGKPHATLEIQDNEIIQLQGKQNRAPKRNYIAKLIPLIRKHEFSCLRMSETLGYIVDANDKWHPIEQLPDNLLINGNLLLRDAKIKSLPNNLHVEGNLEIGNTLVTFLPEKMYIGKSISAYGSLIKTLPTNLFVRAELDLRHSKIKTLPTGLKVTKSLLLGNTDIDFIPDDIIIGGSLDLMKTSIRELPKGLSIGGSLYLWRSDIRQLPAGLTVGGDLYMPSTQITSLPSDLVVKGDLLLEDTEITSIPDGVTVGGEVRYGKKKQVVFGRLST